jgi:predicted Zn-dependent protease
MPNRKTVVLAGRAASLLTAALAAVVISSCAGFGPRGFGQSSAGLLSSSASPRALERERLNQILDGSPGTYIGQLIAERDSTIERWPAHESQPLHIWIDSSSTIGGAQAGFPAAVRAAFSEWSRTGIPLRFAYVTSPRDADVRVRWTNHLAHKTGSTTWRTDRKGWLVSGDITLATHISDGHALDARGMRAIALHEVGHALGMSHSFDDRDIMAPLVHVDDLSGADRETIRLLYSLTAGPVGR